MPKITTILDDFAYAEFSLRAKQATVYKAGLLREIVLAYLLQPRQFPHLAPNSRNAETKHMSVRLPMFQADDVIDRATSKGMSASRWMACLIQSHLMRDPVMGAGEIEALRASNRELRAIGINLNQIAHALNIKFEETDRIKLEVIDELITSLKENQAAIRDLVRHSQNDWSAE